MIKGYFKGKYVKCTCTSPQGQPQWYTGSQKVPGTTKDLSVSFDHSKPERNFTCKSSSTSGAGSKLVVKFAFFEPNSVTIQSSSSTIDLCPHTGIYTNIRHTTTCWVSKDKMSPAPDLRFTVDSVTYPGKLKNDPLLYKADFLPSPFNSVGIMPVKCNFTNTITGQSQTKQMIVTFRRPPLYPPVITFKTKLYTGKAQGNRVTLPAGYAGDMTCGTPDGFPLTESTRLTCQTLTSTGAANQTKLTFRPDQLSFHLDDTVCNCTTKHVTGCYYNNVSFLKLHITYAPVVAFTYSPAVPEFQKGDTLRFECSATGNPPPSLTITRKATNQQLASVRRKLKQATLFHKLSPLDCLDTDEYVCSGQNNQGVNREEISVIVKFLPTAPNMPVDPFNTSGTATDFLDTIVTTALFLVPTIFFVLAVTIASFEKEKSPTVKRKSAATEEQHSFTAKNVEQLSFNKEVNEAATLAVGHGKETLGLETEEGNSNILTNLTQATSNAQEKENMTRISKVGQQ
ncbi:basement membrane-specific heparan sulfate proteoglycan core protein-like [Plakobranchus ocellatus]|uniref:Basement membrane-specific heparan sulfate proteoglycan core protein-like n=1 Tax=Plakobranchus ocellatus TaxID=259542 RepID=A0AAV4CWT5_9GAST|nr:basement membrane-specific heparan sulfate proteoglycan core protein-like [Plakobranchus ocellatus]